MILIAPLVVSHQILPPHSFNYQLPQHPHPSGALPCPPPVSGITSAALSTLFHLHEQEVALMQMCPLLPAAALAPAGR